MAREWVHDWCKVYLNSWVIYVFIAYCVAVSKYRYILHVKSSIDDHFLNDVDITQEVVRVISISSRKYCLE